MLDTTLTGIDKTGIFILTICILACWWLVSDMLAALNAAETAARLDREYTALGIYGYCTECGEPLTYEGRCSDWACHKAWSGEVQEGNSE